MTSTPCIERSREFRLLLTVTAVLAVTACSLGDGGATAGGLAPQSAPEPTPPLTRPLAPSRLVHADIDYRDTVESLMTSADAIVVGSFPADGEVYSQSDDGLIVHLASPFNIESVVKGTLTSGSQVHVIRSVFSDTREAVGYDGSGGLQLGDRYLLFLTAMSDSTFVTMSGHQGAFAVHDATLHPLDRAAPTSTALDGMTIDRLTNLVANTPIN